MQKPRLQRLPRLYTQCAVYFVTACTQNRKRLLDNTAIHDSLSVFCCRANDRGVFVGRYVVMPDHLHLFVAFSPGSVRLSDWMKSLKNTLSQTLRERGISSPHWQKGFFDHVLRSQESYSEKWAYVLLNPVRAGLAASPDEWPYQGEIHPLQFEPL